MGCDIHVYVERKVNGVWEHCPKDMGPVDPFYTNVILKKPASERTEQDEYWNRRTWDPGRSYMLFGVLAGVRYHEVTPISPPRGIPEDTCSFIKDEFERWDGDGHSFSYFYISELLKAANEKCVMTGYLDIKDYNEYKEIGIPRQWYNEHQVFEEQIISNEEMDKRVNNIAFWDGKKYVTEVLWEQPYTEFGSNFWKIIVPAMAELDPNPENVRMVFWFDN